MILLDTDVMIDILRGYEPAVQWLEALQEQEIGVPGLVAMELIQVAKPQESSINWKKNCRYMNSIGPTRRIASGHW